jgi:hypothetical protein
MMGIINGKKCTDCMLLQSDHLAAYFYAHDAEVDDPSPIDERANPAPNISRAACAKKL